MYRHRHLPWLWREIRKWQVLKKNSILKPICSAVIWKQSVTEWTALRKQNSLWSSARENDARLSEMRNRQRRFSHRNCMIWLHCKGMPTGFWATPHRRHWMPPSHCTRKSWLLIREQTASIWVMIWSRQQKNWQNFWMEIWIFWNWKIMNRQLTGL